MKTNPKLLVVETSSHFQVLEQLQILLAPRFELTFYCVGSKKNKLKFQCSSLSPSSHWSAPLKGVFMLANVFIKSKKYDFINISTGPEGNHFTDLLNVLFFYLIASIYGGKVVLTVRNISPYLQTTSGIFSYIRNKAIQKIDRITFETQALRQEFIKKDIAPKARLGVIYFRLSDTNRYLTNTDPLSVDQQSVKIGLLGAVDTQRRNYYVLLESLVALPLRVRDKTVIVVLGRCQGEEADSIISQMRSYVKVIKIANVLSEEELTVNGMSCDVLLAPLRTDKDYGRLKGTGAVADAIYLRRPLIIPSVVDSEREFKDFCLYYNTASDLTAMFQSIVKRARLIKSGVFTKYTAGNVLIQLLKDLEINSVLLRPSID